MKKRILATTIAGILVSGAASAATLYEKDDLTINVDGDYQVQLFQDIGTDEDAGVDFDDLQLNIGAQYNLNNGMTAFGNISLDYLDQGDNIEPGNVVDEAYVGLKAGAFTGSIGRQYWGTDSFGVEKAYELDGGNAFPTTGGTDTVKATYVNPRFTATVAHDLAEDNDEKATDLFVTTKFGPAEIGVGYQDYEASDTNESIETTAVMASFDIGRTNVGIDYSTNDDADFTNAAIGFPIRGNTSGAVGATLESPDGGEDVTTWYMNATHQLNSNVSVFAEVGDDDADGTSAGYVTGLRVKF